MRLILSSFLQDDPQMDIMKFIFYPSNHLKKLCVCSKESQRRIWDFVELSMQF